MWLQFDIRTLCINHWGSDEGITVLKQLGQLYMFLIWETIVLETVSRSDTSSDETKVFDKDLEMLKASTSASQEEPSGTKQYLRCIHSDNIVVILVLGSLFSVLTVVNFVVNWFWRIWCYIKSSHRWMICARPSINITKCCMLTLFAFTLSFTQLHTCRTKVLDHF